MNEQHDDEQLQERLMASLALGVQRREPEASAWRPDPNQWQAFLDGRLALEDQEAVMAYLDTHPDAYEQWLAHARPEPTTRTPTLLQRLGEWVTVRGRLLPAAALAVVALLSLGLLLQSPAGVDTELDRVYVRVAALGLSAGSAPDLLQDPAFGFAGSGVQSHTLQAFIQGIGAGRRQLEETLGASAKSGEQQGESRWPEYYRLGRWYYLTWFVARTGLTPQERFWGGQERILERIRAALPLARDEAALPVSRQLDGIAGLLGRLEGSPDDARARRDLRRELESLWQLMRMAEGS
jgi:hypothetical protein